MDDGWWMRMDGGWRMDDRRTTDDGRVCVRVCVRACARVRARERVRARVRDEDG